MAYTTLARVQFLLGPDRTATLQAAREDSGAIDPGLFAALEHRIANRINGALGVRYVMPCAAIDDDPPTPEQVSDLDDIGIAWLLYAHLIPTAEEGEYYREQFEGEDGESGQLGRYRANAETVIGLAERSATTGKKSAAFESIGTTVAGAFDSAGDRTGDWSQDPHNSTDQARGI